MTRCAFIAIVAACGQPSEPAAPAHVVSPAVASPGRLDLGMPMVLRSWSDDGRYAVFEAQPGTERWARQPVNIIVDATTLTSFELDRATQLEFAPDGQHLAAVVGDNLVVYDLATAQPIGKPSPLYGNPGFTPDRRLGWIERAGNEFRIHLRDLATGADRVLVGLPVSPGYTEQAREPITLGYDQRGHVMAWTRAAIRVWENDAPQPIAAVDSAVVVTSELNDDGLTYTVRVGEHSAFGHIDLVEHRTPVELHRSRACGAGEIKTGSKLERCAANRYLVRGLHELCVWDTQRGELLASIDDARDRNREDDQYEYEEHNDNRYACHGDVVRVTDGRYRYFSALTGKRIRDPHDFVDPPRALAVLTGQPVRSDKLPPDATDTRMSPNHTMIAGILNDRGTLWTPTGRLVWQTPAPSQAAQIALSSNGELVAVGHDGHIWHVDLNSHALRTGKLADCVITDDAPITTTADGRVVATCTYGNSRHLVLEGEDKPLYTSSDHGWNVSVSTTATATTAAWVSGGSAHVFSLPDGVEQWSFPVGFGFSVTNDRRRFAAVDELGVNSRRYLLTIRDATNHALAIAALRHPPSLTLFSPDGAYLASEDATGDIIVMSIYDTKLGNVVDTFRTLTPAIAWDPSGAPRIASWLPGNLGLSIRDVTKRQPDEVRLAFVDGAVHGMAWSDDALAVIADQRIVVWTSWSRETIALAGSTGIELRANTTATLLGDPTRSRGMFSCRVGTQSSPTMWCDDKLVDP